MVDELARESKEQRLSCAARLSMNIFLIDVEFVPFMGRTGRSSHQRTESKHLQIFTVALNASSVWYRYLAPIYPPLWVLLADQYTLVQDGYYLAMHAADILTVVVYNTTSHTHISCSQSSLERKFSDPPEEVRPQDEAHSRTRYAPHSRLSRIIRGTH